MWNENAELIGSAAGLCGKRVRLRVLARSLWISAPKAKRRIDAVAGCRKGAVAFEFVMVAPIMLFILFAIMNMAVALDNFLVLTAASQQGAQTLSLGRGTSNPYTTAKNAFTQAAGSLTTSSITPTFKIGSTACSTDAACTPLLTAGSSAALTLTYPCNITIMGYSFGGSPCTLSSQSAAVVQ